MLGSEKKVTVRFYHSVELVLGPCIRNPDKAIVLASSFTGVRLQHRNTDCPYQKGGSYTFARKKQNWTRRLESAQFKISSAKAAETSFGAVTELQLQPRHSTQHKYNMDDRPLGMLSKQWARTNEAEFWKTCSSGIRRFHCCTTKDIAAAERSRSSKQSETVLWQTRISLFIWETEMMGLRFCKVDSIGPRILMRSDVSFERS